MEELLIQDRKSLKYLLNFIIKAKDESVDKFVLFNEESNSLILEIGRNYTSYAGLVGSNESAVRRSFNLQLSPGSGVYQSMVVKLISLLEQHDDIYGLFRRVYEDGNLNRLLISYFSPFEVDQTAADSCANVVSDFIKSRNSI